MGILFSHHEEYGPRSADFRANIRYCGSWGYYSYAAVAEDLLTNEFGDKLHVLSDKERCVTGNLRIKITNNKTGDSIIVHDKNAGDGYIDSRNKRLIVDKVKKFMSQ